MKVFVPVFLILAVLFLPQIASATVDLYGDTGYLFDPQEDYGAMLYDGTSDAYDDFYGLALGTSQSAMADYEGDGTYTQSGRTVTFPTLTINGLEVSRKFYVPSSDSFPNADWGRYLDCIRNPGTSPVTLNVAIGGIDDFNSWDFEEDVYGDLGSDDYTIVTDSSDGDTSFDTTDTWFASDDDADGYGDPSLGHVIQGPGAPYPVTTVDDLISADDEFSWIFEGVTINGGQTVCFLTFAIQADYDSDARNAAAALVGLPQEALDGLSVAEMANVVNFDIQVQQESVSVPTMTEWGMLIFMVLAGLGAVYYMRKDVRSS